MKKEFLLLLIISMSISSCSQGRDTPYPEQALTASQISTPPISETPMSPTADVENGTPTPPQSLPTLVSPVIQHCLEPSEELSFEEVARNGTIVASTDDSVARLIDLETSSSYEVPTMQKDPYRLSDMHLSPDRTTLAYYENFLNANGEYEKSIMWVTNTRGEVLAQMTLSSRDAAQFHWLDNDHLQIYSQKTYRDGTIGILNPYSGEWQQLTNDLPNLFQIRYTELIPWLVEYNRDLDLVVYLGQSDDGKSGPVVWDISAQKIIWQYLDAGTNYAIPLWSPTSKEVAIVTNDGQLYVIDEDGLVNQLPELGTQNNVRSFSWSPDGNVIAFWNAYDNFERSRLMIYDTRTNQVTDFCITAEETSGSDPVWSPDSQMFFAHVPIIKDDGSFSSATILVDIAQNTAYSLSREPKPLEWMNSTP
jgi:dipeptidyl aminopeptidase/acylaminoacyl peptidase